MGQELKIVKHINIYYIFFSGNEQKSIDEYTH